MFRLIAAGLLLATAPALAAPNLSTTHVEAGGPSGKTPHRAYRPIVQEHCRTTAMHTIPAGKIHHFGAGQAAPCGMKQAVATATPRATAPAAAGIARD